jgi:putative ABC transport system substrate-binding protein
MRRREFIGLLGGAVIAWPGSSHADKPAKIWRVGIVQGTGTEQLAKELESRLGDLGYADGKNIVLVKQFAEPNLQAVENAISSLIPDIDLLVVGERSVVLLQRSSSPQNPLCSFRSVRRWRSDWLRASPVRAGT